LQRPSQKKLSRSIEKIRAGTTYLFHSPDHPEAGYHLCLVLTDPKEPDQKVVVVTLLTARERTDDTVILGPDHHPWIDHETSVDYRAAKLLRADRISYGINKRLCHPRSPMSDSLLRLVRQGLIDSPHALPWIKNYCLERF